MAERSAAPEPKRYLGYGDGELVRDQRTAALGRVRVCDDDEVGRYAEVQWAGSFVQDELEVAIDNGLTAPGAVPPGGRAGIGPGYLVGEERER